MNENTLQKFPLLSVDMAIAATAMPHVRMITMILVAMILCHFPSLISAGLLLLFARSLYQLNTKAIAVTIPRARVIILNHCIFLLLTVLL